MALRKVLLVGWDAADWKVIRPLMDAGKMPNIQRLVREGASGQIATLHPPLSPMLWTSIATGKRPFHHGILGFSEPTPDGRGVQPVTNLSRKAKALWNILNQNDLRSVVIGWWPSHPAEPIHGVMISDHYSRATGPLAQGWPLIPGAIHPPELAKTLAGHRVHPDSLTPEMVAPFIPLAEQIDQDKDKRLAHFLRTLAECMSVQSAATWLLDDQPWDFFAVYYEAIDHFCHGFMRYHPPRQSFIHERDFEIYHNVVSMAYQFHDRMLGTLLEKAGEDVTVILLSDHGFHPDHLRPAEILDVPAGPTIEHRDYGVFVISGPDIQPGTTLHGASLLDVAPTVLALYDLPVGEDMDGKVLLPCRAHSIPTWEAVPGADGRHPPHLTVDPVAAHEALERLIALGYIDRPDENRELAVELTLRELRYNLAGAYQDAARHLEAHQLLSELHAADPDEQRFAVRLFVSCQALGLKDEMRRIVDEATQKIGHFQAPVVHYLTAQVLTAEGRYEDALAALEHVAEAHLVRPGVSLEAADLYLRLGRLREAQEIYQKALAINHDDADAHLGLCRVALRRRKFDAAAQSALDALELFYHAPMAHFLLGLALTGLKDYEPAAEAFRAAISFNPNFPEAHLKLARLLDPSSAREHRLLARRMRRSKVRRPPPQSLAETVESLAPEPSDVTLAATDSVIIVTGLPRSGTSMLMQMLAAGGLPMLSDGLRTADEDNPRGYFEFEPVKQLLKNSNWLFEAKGKVVKIVAPLLLALPPNLPCRVILCERNLDEVIDSQDRMLSRRGQPGAGTPEMRQLLKDEYDRTLKRVKAMLKRRPSTQLLVIEHREAINHPSLIAARVAAFLGGGLDVAKMAAAVDPALHRNRSVSIEQR